MLTVYLISPRDRPHITLFTARTLEDAAESVAAQPDPEALLVYANVDGFSRDLNAEEQRRLAELT